MKRHEKDTVSLVFGLLFVAIVGWWVLTTVARIPTSPFVTGAAVLIAIGVIGLATSVRWRRGSAATATDPLLAADTDVDSSVSNEFLSTTSTSDTSDVGIHGIHGDGVSGAGIPAGVSGAGFRGDGFRGDGVQGDGFQGDGVQGDGTGNTEVFGGGNSSTGAGGTSVLPAEERSDVPADDRPLTDRE